MSAVDHHTPVNTGQIKDVIYQRIGPEKANSYFNNLERFLNLKMSKIEFDKSCRQIFGRENLSLHNFLIRSIIHNAKIPPKEARKDEALNVNGGKRSHLQSLCADTLPQPPRKCRSSLSKDRKLKEHKSPPGPLGKSWSVANEETVSRLQEQQSGAELHTLSGRPLVGPTVVEDGEEVEQTAVIPPSRRWASVTAPIGVSLNMGGDHNRRGIHSLDNCLNETCQSSRELPDTKSLGRRLQKKLGEDGVGITRDGANLLNKSLDVYLKKIISQCVGIAGAQCADPSSGKLVSGGFYEISPSQFIETPMQPPRQHTCVSMLDFRVAMESNPTVLGEDWPVQLEKISNYI